jgi:cytochrome c-type biogenesis protein CcmH
MVRPLRTGLVITLLFMLTTLWAAEEIVTFDSAEQSQLYHSLLKEYRCLKCQNQNLSNSKASLAGDLRREIREQILAGGTKQDIDGYLIARYGDFVLYSPPFSAQTAVLWIAPFALLAIALVSVFIMIRRQRNHAGQAQYSHIDSDVANKELLEKAKRLLRG